MKFKLRPMTVDDQDFVVQSWLEYYKAYSQYGKAVPGKVFFREHRKLIKQTLEHSPCMVACDQADESFLLGFACLEQLEAKQVDVLHFAFVRKDFRQKGIGKALVQSLKSLTPDLEFSHQGDILGLWNLYKTKLFNPYHFFGIR